MEGAGPVTPGAGEPPQAGPALGIDPVIGREPVGDIAGNLWSATGDLVRSHVQLLKVETRQNGRRAGVALAQFAGAGVAAGGALVLLGGAIVALLASIIGWFLAFLATAVLVAAGAAVLAFLGLGNARRLALLPERLLLLVAGELSSRPEGSRAAHERRVNARRMREEIDE